MPKKGPKKDNFLLCKCCGRSVNKDHFELGCDLKDFSFLGSGYPLYFVFIQSCILIMVLFLITSGLFSIVTNKHHGEKCWEPAYYDGELEYYEDNEEE